MGEVRRRLVPGVLREQLVEAAGGGARGVGLGAVALDHAIEPPEVGEQEARIVVQAVTGDLPLVDDRDLDPVDRAAAEQALAVRARMDQRASHSWAKAASCRRLR